MEDFICDYQCDECIGKCFDTGLIIKQGGKNREYRKSLRGNEKLDRI